MGSARDEAELGLLMEEARRLLEDDRQGVLDLGVTPQARRVAMVPAPGQPALFGGEPAPGVRQMVPRARTLKTASGLLYNVLAGVYADLGFDALGDEVFRDLVIARVVEPTSLLDVDRVLAEMGRVSASLSTRKRTLRRCFDGNYRDRLAELCFTRVLACGDVSLVLYDVTTLYFEAEHEDGLRKVGYSKERRVDPQIVVGLLVDRQGFPLEIGCFEGDKAEKLTILPVIRQFQARHGLEAMVVVADAGHALGREPGRPGRGGAGVHRRLAGHQGPGRPGVALPLARRRVHRRAGHRHRHPEDRQEHRQRPGPAGRARLGPGGPPEVVAGGLGVLREAVRAGQQDPHRAGEPRPRRHQRREVRPHAPVRQERGRDPGPGREGPRPRAGSWPG